MPSAYVLIICELGYEDQTVNDLNKMDGVEATRLAGAYDVIAKVNAENAESLTGSDSQYMDNQVATFEYQREILSKAEN